MYLKHTLNNTKLQPLCVRPLRPVLSLELDVFSNIRRLVCFGGEWYPHPYTLFQPSERRAVLRCQHATLRSMPPLRRNLAPRLAMHSRANKSRRRRRAMRLQVLVVPLCLLSAVTALALRLAFCDAQSTRLGHAKTLRAAGHLQGGRRTDSTGSRGPTGQRGRPSCELAQCRVEAGRGGCVDSRDGRTVRGELSIYANTRRAPAARLPEERGRNAFVLSTWGWTPRHHCQGEGRQAADTSRSVRGSRKLLPLRPATTMIAPAQLPHRSSSALFHSTLVVHTRVSPRSGPENGLQYAASYHNDEIPRRRLRSKCLGSCSDSGLLLPLSSSEAAFMASARRRDAMSTTLRASAENEDGECLETSPPAWAAGRRSPLLITIGPQCAGKTTLLRSLAARARTRGDSSSDSSSAGDAGREITTVTDVSIDDHPSVSEYECRTKQRAVPCIVHPATLACTLDIEACIDACCASLLPLRYVHDMLKTQLAMHNSYFRCSHDAP